MKDGFEFFGDDLEDKFKYMSKVLNRFNPSMLKNEIKKFKTTIPHSNKFYTQNFSFENYNMEEDFKK